MNLTCRIALFPAAILLALILFWQTDSDIPPETGIHLGVWTCDSAQPGNRIRFWNVETESCTPWVRAFDGRVTIDGILGMEAAAGEWNFGYWRPLIVNLKLGDTFGYAAIRKIDDDHLLLRYTTDCNVLLDAPFKHPDVLHLRRVRGEAE